MWASKGPPAGVSRGPRRSPDRATDRDFIQVGPRVHFLSQHGRAANGMGLRAYGLGFAVWAFMHSLKLSETATVSGESGAGKTEARKHVMSSIASRASGEPSHSPSVSLILLLFPFLFPLFGHPCVCFCLLCSSVLLAGSLSFCVLRCMTMSVSR